MLSIGFMYLFRIRSSALIMSSALTSRIVMAESINVLIEKMPVVAKTVLR